MRALYSKVTPSLSITMLLMSLGCVGPRFDTQSVRFYQTFPETGKSFFVYPLQTENLNSPEFFHYAGIIAENLEEKGYRLAGKDKIADYLVVLGYGIDGGREKLYSVPIFGQTGGGSTYHAGNFTGSGSNNSGNSYNYGGTYSGYSFKAPTFGVVGASTGSRTIYKRELYLNILEIKPSQEKKFNSIYTGRVTSSGSSGEISEVVPYMVKAMFKDFDAASGKTKKKK